MSALDDRNSEEEFAEDMEVLDESLEEVLDEFDSGDEEDVEKPNEIETVKAKVKTKGKYKIKRSKAK